MYTRAIIEGKAIWDYLKSFREEKEMDYIVVCCSYDLRVCDHAVELFKRYKCKKIIFSGNRGNWTRDLWREKEARIFKERALKLGVPEKSILTEERATNLGENIQFSKDLLENKGRVCFVSKPNTLLRIRLTLAVQWEECNFTTSSPDFNFPEEVSNIVGLNETINEMVGDIERIFIYPKMGYQSKHKFPLDIIDSWNYLIDKGFTSHMVHTLS